MYPNINVCVSMILCFFKYNLRAKNGTRNRREDENTSTLASLPSCPTLAVVATQEVHTTHNDHYKTVGREREVTMMLLFTSVIFLTYLNIADAQLPHLTLGDIPFYKNPCSGNTTEWSEQKQARCRQKFSFLGFGQQGLGFNKIKKSNNVYCKVFRLCLNFSYGNLYLSAYGFWRGHGFYPPRNYNIHSTGGNKFEESVEVQKPTIEELKNAISQLRRKMSEDSLTLGVREESDAEKISKELGEGRNEKRRKRRWTR
ncbi:hypothetical protein PFISCL1PPCAC_11907 [Pristionchus fissidentatus]|uniref:Uncharacterized protein n=1 Tax=Pristionchus fissidentatus TaxID=1538716 RepID=A0AAV5VRK9_9BILA|nr:hypothetical protein PFISCL1PPCAC_11907 [Pristionchus fissidentatus]